MRWRKRPQPEPRPAPPVGQSAGCVGLEVPFVPFGPPAVVGERVYLYRTERYEGTLTRDQMDYDEPLGTLGVTFDDGSWMRVHTLTDLLRSAQERAVPDGREEGQ